MQLECDPLLYSGRAAAYQWPWPKYFPALYELPSYDLATRPVLSSSSTQSSRRTILQYIFPLILSIFPPSFLSLVSPRLVNTNTYSDLLLVRPNGCRRYSSCFPAVASTGCPGPYTLSKLPCEFQSQTGVLKPFHSSYLCSCTVRRPIHYASSPGRSSRSSPTHMVEFTPLRNDFISSPTRTISNTVR